MPRVKHAESCGDHEEIVEEEVVVEILAKSQQEANDTNDVPKGSIRNHARVEAPFLIIKCRRTYQNQVVENQRDQRVLIAKRVFLLENNYDTDSKSQSVALPLLRQPRQVDDQVAVLNKHEDI